MDNGERGRENVQQKVAGIVPVKKDMEMACPVNIKADEGLPEKWPLKRCVCVLCLFWSFLLPI